MIKSNSNLLEKIKNKLFSGENFYVGLKLEISKTFFIFIAFLYFLSYISVLGGLFPEYFSQILFVIYPVFVFSVFALLFDIGNYMISVYSLNKLLKYIILAILVLIYIFLILTHLGLKLI
ncbi:hypothetical protein M0P65_04180 [Candidatus Gracilibacteria bacterium]|nr:hypothetical protein [Candidatus Gracilibacteria bacterium]